MKAAQIAVDITSAGGALWVEDGHLKAKSIPAHLIPVIRENKTALLALLKAEAGIAATIASTMQPAPAMAPQSAPATVSCGQCVRFQPGTTKMGIGVCLATTNGLPPKEQRGYRAAFPMAPRRCPEYAGSPS